MSGSPISLTNGSDLKLSIGCLLGNWAAPISRPPLKRLEVTYYTFAPDTRSWLRLLLTPKLVPKPFSHPLLLATDSNWNLNTDRDELPSKQGGFIVPVLSDTTRTGSGSWLWRLLIFPSSITNLLSTVFSKSFFLVSTVFSKCVTLSSTQAILLLTDSCISCSYLTSLQSSFKFLKKLLLAVFGFLL